MDRALRRARGLTPAEQALLALFEADRAEERRVVAGTPEYVALRDRDRQRLREADAILAAETVTAPEALYAAAWLFNHGDTPDEASRGHELALQADALGHRAARWLAAAALDRSLMYAGRPQKYGTNMVPDGVGWRVWDVDPATTDEERAAWDVPSLAEMHARAAAIDDPLPPLDTAPAWLRDALERWRRQREGQGRR